MMGSTVHNLEIGSPKRSHRSQNNWEGFFPYYAGYPEAFALNILKSANLPPFSIVLDPWNGSGTTTFAASNLGLSSVGFDINPVMVVIARARLLGPSEADSIEPITKEVLRGLRSKANTVGEDDPLLAWFSAFPSFVKCTEYLTSEQRLSGFDQELVLRFFALKNRRSRFKHEVEDFLTDYMEDVADAAKPERFDFAAEEENFQKTFEALSLTLGDFSFALATPLVALTLSKVFAALRDVNSKHPEFSKLIDDKDLHQLARERAFIDGFERISLQHVEIPDHVVDTKSNLNSLVLKRNLYQLGLRYPVVQKHGSAIDRLLGVRNAIAHGDKLKEPKEGDVRDYLLAAFEVMKFVQAEIFDALTKKVYQKDPNAGLPQTAAEPKLIDRAFENARLYSAAMKEYVRKLVHHSPPQR